LQGRSDEQLQLRHAVLLLNAVVDQREHDLAARFYRDVPEGRIQGLLRAASDLHLLRWLARAVESCCDPSLADAAQGHRPVPANHLAVDAGVDQQP
jgi:hypothetical protein